MKKIERIKDRIIITLVFLVTIVLAVLLLMSCEKVRVENSTSKRCYCNEDSIKAYIQQEVAKQLTEIYD